MKRKNKKKTELNAKRKKNENIRKCPYTFKIVLKYIGNPIKTKVALDWGF